MLASNHVVELTQVEAPTPGPPEADVAEYAAWLGVDTEFERDLFPICRAGLVAALPKHWVACNTEGTEDIFFFNKRTGESIWDHPLDEFYRQLVVKSRAQRQCYVVSLALLEVSGESKIQGTNLAGDLVVEQTTAPDEIFGDMEAKVRSAIVVDDERVLCFALPSGKLIGFSCRAKPIKDIFKRERSCST